MGSREQTPAALDGAFNAIVAWWRALEPAAKDLYLSKDFPVVFSYNSGKIENDQITLHDTREIFEHGRVVAFTGDLRTLFEVGNLRDAWPLMLALSRGEGGLGADDLLELHATLTKGTYDEARWAGGERPGTFKKGDYVVAGEVGYPPDEAADAVRDLLAEVDEALKGPNPGPTGALTIAAYAHAKLVEIHPFADGNGRCARALQNICLMRASCPPIVVSEADRMAYYGALDAFHEEGDLEPFKCFCAVQAIETWGGPAGLVRPVKEPGVDSPRRATQIEAPRAHDVLSRAQAEQGGAIDGPGFQARHPHG